MPLFPTVKVSGCIWRWKLVGRGQGEEDGMVRVYTMHATEVILAHFAFNKAMFASNPAFR